MSSHTASRAACGLTALLMVTGAARAAVECPRSLQGRDLRLVDGGSLYLGNPADGMLQAPDRSERGTTGPINIWTFRSAQGMHLVCRYEGIRETMTLPLPAATRTCRQDARTLSFVCQ